MKDLGKLTGESASSPEQSPDTFMLTAIEGVDTGYGIRRFGQSEETYIKILTSYTVNTRRLLNDIEVLLESERLSDYAIAVHGIKGSSRGIGAFEAGTSAERLELLAKSGNAKQVHSDSIAFLEYMTGLLDSIDDSLKLHCSINRKPGAGFPEPALLRELREACGKYDAGMVDTIMAQLESFEYDSGAELMAWLREQADDMNYDTIANGKWPCA